MNDKLCICGHAEEAHNLFGKNLCWECPLSKLGHAFKLDNLKYLERIYNEKKV